MRWLVFGFGTIWPIFGPPKRFLEAKVLPKFGPNHIYWPKYISDQSLIFGLKKIKIR